MTTDSKILLGIAGIAALAGLFALGAYTYKPLFTAQEVSVNVTLPQPIGAITLPDSALTAQAALLYNPNTKEILYAKNEESQLPLASLTKLATALAVLSQGENTMITVGGSALSEEGDSGLRVGEVWRLGDLISFALTTSSNDATAAAAEALSRTGTVDRMNAEAQARGLSQSYFLNPTGLDLSSSTAGAYGSAKDVAALVETLLRTYPAIFEATAYGPKLEAGSSATAQSTLTPMQDVAGFVAGKTGYTDLAGGNLAAVVDIGLNEPVIAVVLGSTREGRFEDVRRMIEAVKSQAR